MMIALVLLAFTFAFVLFLLRQAPWKLKVGSPDELDQLLLPISLPALTNLLAEENVEFLRRQLSPTDFRRSIRQRNVVFCVYLRRIAHNARVLIAVAERQQETEPEETSRELLQAAMATRTQAVYALAKLYAARALPGMIADVTDAVRSYQSTSAQWQQFQGEHSMSGRWVTR